MAVGLFFCWSTLIIQLGPRGGTKYSAISIAWLYLWMNTNHLPNIREYWTLTQ